MKVCPKCRHINEDWDEWCSSCNYSLSGIRPLGTEAPKKRINKNALIVIIVAICVAAVLLFAIFSNYQSSYTLPQWILDRMSYQRTPAEFSVGGAMIPYNIFY